MVDLKFKNFVHIVREYRGRAAFDTPQAVLFNCIDTICIIPTWLGSLLYDNDIDRHIFFHHERLHLHHRYILFACVLAVNHYRELEHIYICIDFTIILLFFFFSPK